MEALLNGCHKHAGLAAGLPKDNPLVDPVAVAVAKGRGNRARIGAVKFGGHVVC